MRDADLSRSTTDGESPHWGPVPAAVYVAMLAATITGQFAGMVVDRLAFGRRVVWVPVVCSVLLEAFVGARFGAARIARRLTVRDCARVSVYYSFALAWLSVPLALWSVASSRTLGVDASPGNIFKAVGVVLAGLVLATLLRCLLMVVFSWRPR